MFYEYWISMDIHALTCYGFSIQEQFSPASRQEKLGYLEYVLLVKEVSAESKIMRSNSLALPKHGKFSHFRSTLSR